MQTLQNKKQSWVILFNTTTKESLVKLTQNREVKVRYRCEIIIKKVIKNNSYIIVGDAKIGVRLTGFLPLLTSNCYLVIKENTRSSTQFFR